MGLRKIISGAQTGADQAGLFVGRRFGLETGGAATKGCRTKTGLRRDLIVLYGLTELDTDDYPTRTYHNAAHSDGTIRLAANFSTAGERCTLRCLKSAKKPWFDVDLADPPPIGEAAAWIAEHHISVLNVAGNSEDTFPGCYQKSVEYLSELLFELGFEIRITLTNLIASMKLMPGKELVDDRGNPLEFIAIRKVR